MTTITSELHPISLKSPWYDIGINFVGPFTTSTMNIRYILTINDYCSKWVEAIALPSKCASGVASALFKVRLKSLLKTIGMDIYGQTTTNVYLLENSIPSNPFYSHPFNPQLGIHANWNFWSNYY